MADLATTATDGKNSIKRESRFGVITAGAVFFVLQAAAQGLSGLDTSDWSGWWVPLATGALAALSGLATAYKTRNRK